MKGGRENILEIRSLGIIHLGPKPIFFKAPQVQWIFSYGFIFAHVLFKFQNKDFYCCFV